LPIPITSKVFLTLSCINFRVLGLICLFIIQFFLWGGGHSVQEAMLTFPRGGCGITGCCLFAHLLVCQAGWELVPGGAGALLVSPYAVHWGSYVQARGAEVLEFCPFLVVFPVQCVSSISGKFLL
jgi:hypothetical protein